MKKYISLIVVALAVIFAGCKKTSQGVTRITYYPTITLEGSLYMTMNVGGAYTEPGFTAVMNGEDISKDVTVTNNIDATTPGLYQVNYSFVNPDGIAANKVRYVIVVPAGDNIGGHYSSDPASFRIASGKTVAYGGAFGVLVIPTTTPGTYDVDDLLGGWYAQRAGYGGAYACVGKISVNAAGVVTMLGSSVAGWGDSADSLTGTFNSATGTFTWTVMYAGMSFNVTLHKD